MRIRRLLPVLLVLAVALGLIGTVPAGATKGSGQDEAIPFTAATVTQTAEGYDVAWKAPNSAGAVKVYAGTNPTDVGTTDKVGSGKSTGTIAVTGLAAAPRWYFELVPAKGGSLVIADRYLHLASAPNFRDVGGYRTTDGKWVRMGVLYRADALNKLTDADLATVDALGIKLVCDLRTTYERTKDVDRPIAGAENIQLDVSGQDDLTKTITEAITTGGPDEQQRLFGDGKGKQLMMDGGRAYVSSETGKAAYSSMFQRLEDPASLPTVLHCTGGKDRTGWAAAAVLTALGVPRSTVTADYLISNDTLKAKNESTLAQTAALIDPELLAPLIGVDKSYLDASFAEVKAKYRTFANYLAKGVGVDAEAKAKLERELLVG